MVRSGRHFGRSRLSSFQLTPMFTQHPIVSTLHSLQTMLYLVSRPRPSSLHSFCVVPPDLVSVFCSPEPFTRWYWRSFTSLPVLSFPRLLPEHQENSFRTTQHIQFNTLKGKSDSGFTYLWRGGDDIRTDQVHSRKGKCRKRRDKTRTSRLS